MSDDKPTWCVEHTAYESPSVHQKIRALEARVKELLRENDFLKVASLQDVRDWLGEEWKARAEKAEAWAVDAERECQDTLDALKKAEAELAAAREAWAEGRRT